jgi:hypothetical protein
VLKFAIDENTAKMATLTDEYELSSNLGQSMVD